MKKLVFLAATLTSLAVAQAQNFTVTMTPAQDGNSSSLPGHGSGTLTLDTTLDTLTFNNITFSGLSAVSTAGHIHGPGAPGVSVGVLYTLGQPAGMGGFFTLGSTSGSINGTLPLVTLGTYTVPKQLSDLESGLWYINVHDSVFPGGEIRGQILPVPEPSTLPLLGIGVCGLWLLLRRHRSR
jgi:hypothetical protein